METKKPTPLERRIRPLLERLLPMAEVDELCRLLNNEFSEPYSRASWILLELAERGQAEQRSDLSWWVEDDALLRAIAMREDCPRAQRLLAIAFDIHCRPFPRSQLTTDELAIVREWEELYGKFLEAMMAADTEWSPEWIVPRSRLVIWWLRTGGREPEWLHPAEASSASRVVN